MTDIEKRIRNIESRLKVLEIDHESRIIKIENDRDFVELTIGILTDDISFEMNEFAESEISDRVREVVDSYLLRRFGDAAYTKNKLKGHKIIITFK